MLEDKIKKIIKQQDLERRLGDKRAEQFWEKIKALPFFGLTDAQILAQLSGQAGAAFDWNLYGLNNVGAIDLKGGQIAFPAIQNPSADPNTLDDNE